MYVYMYGYMLQEIDSYRLNRYVKGSVACCRFIHERVSQTKKNRRVTQILKGELNEQQIESIRCNRPFGFHRWCHCTAHGNRCHSLAYGGTAPTQWCNNLHCLRLRRRMLNRCACQRLGIHDQQERHILKRNPLFSFLSLPKNQFLFSDFRR